MQAPAQLSSYQRYQPSGTMFAVGPSGSDPYLAQRQVASQSAPPSPYYPYQSIAPPTTQTEMGGQLGHSATYPPPQQPMPYPTQAYAPYQPQPPTTPRLPVAEPPPPAVTSDPFTPRSMPAQIAQPDPPGAFQLAPMLGSPAAPAAEAAAEARAQPLSSSEEEEGGQGGTVRSPKKRRRMQIGDVLQR